MKHCCLIVLALALLATVFTHTAVGLTLYVTPDNSTICPSYPCCSLAYYVQFASEYFQSNTAVMFLPGAYDLDGVVILQHLQNFSMIGIENVSTDFRHGFREPASKIECGNDSNGGFIIRNSSQIHMENLILSHCGQNLTSQSTEVRAALAFDTVWDVNITSVVVENSTGYGLHADGVFGSFRVLDSVFTDNGGNSQYYGGNAQFWYENCPEHTSAHLEVSHSRFLFGDNSYHHHHHHHHHHRYHRPTAAGLSLTIHCPSVRVDIENITALENHGYNGGNIAVNFTNFGDSYVRISDSNVSRGYASEGGGLYYIYWSANLRNVSCGVWAANTPAILHISNTHFTENYARLEGGAVYVWLKQAGCTSNKINIEYSTFSRNSVQPSGNGAAMKIIKVLEYQTHMTPQFEITFNNCLFSSNFLPDVKQNQFIGSVMDLYSLQRILFKHCTFMDNLNTPISLLNTNLVFEGNITFQNNTGTNGGALRLCESSAIYIRNNTYVTFIENHALVAGGAIFVQRRCLEAISPCFFQPEISDYEAPLNETMQFEFVDNTAAYAGSALYGGAIDYCYFSHSYPHEFTNDYYNYIFNELFDFTNQNGTSRVASDPYGVCLCIGGRHNCSLKHYTYPRMVYPGEIFQISAVTVGQRGGIVPGTIRAVLVNNGTNNTIPVDFQYQSVSNSCKALKFSVCSGRMKEKIQLNAEVSFLYSQFYYPYHQPLITVKLGHCPWGFKLHQTSEPFKCDCDPLLLDNQITCDINNQTISRRYPTWIGVVNCSNSSYWGQYPQVVFYSHCPFDYCNKAKLLITLNTTDEQCASYRTGMFCGKCTNGYSVSLGSSKCQPCSNYYLFVLPAIALSGVLLVFFLITCNLTVSEGTLNGLIFYANCIQMNSVTFFPSGRTPFLTSVIIGFISWLNLDMGIETCFYNGMDAYAKSWLQFVFPVYIWLVAGIIIYLSRKYVVATRLFGRNAVKVLATLFFLSCAKLQRAVIIALQYATLTYSDGSNKTVWLLDGNVDYFHEKRIPLFAVAVLFGLLTLVYALVLAFVQCLQKAPEIRILFWVKKLKPLLDAYAGPYKDKYRFWFGLLLLIRSLLFGYYALNATGDPNVNLLLTVLASCLVLVLGWGFGGVYKKRSLDVLEAWFLLNLVTLSLFTIYYSAHGGDQIVATYIGIGAALVTFIGILIYHLYKQTGSSIFCQRFVILFARIRKSPSMEPLINRAETTESEEQPHHDISEGPMPPVVRFNVYREPVLEYEDEN